MPPLGYEPFLRAICENPEEDTARLVYADWLDENGDPDRAEFIRLQVAVPAWPRQPNSQFDRAKELLTQHRTAWLAELPKLKGVDWGNFHRGFVNKVTFSAARYLRHQMDEVFAHTPIRVVQARTLTPEHFQWFLSRHYLTRLNTFSAGSWVNDKCLEMLAADPQAVNLEYLDLQGGYRSSTPPHARAVVISDVAATALARSPFLKRIKQLILRGTGITQRGREMLRERFGDGVEVYP